MVVSHDIHQNHFSGRCTAALQLIVFEIETCFVETSPTQLTQLPYRSCIRFCVGSLTG